jgi:hypothetical protein
MTIARTLHRAALITGALAVALSGCSADLSVPREAQVSCTSGTCPDGFTCNRKLLRCIWNPDIDTVAPALVGAATVTPEVARAGSLVTVDFDVSEPLRFDPQVTVANLDTGFDRPLTLLEHTGAHYRYGYYVTGLEPQRDCRIAIRLEDAQGLEAPADGGSVGFDFTPPRFVVPPALTGSPAAVGAEVTVEFAVSEPLGEPPSVRLASGQEFLPAVLVDPFTHTYTARYVAAGMEVEGAPGESVLVTLLDAAGNGADGLPAGAVVFDFTKPRIVGFVEVKPPAAHHGSEVVVSFTASEPLRSVPTVLLSDDPEPIAFHEVSPAPTPPLYSFHYTASKDTDLPGDHAFAITLIDEAGNESDPVAAPTIAFIFTPPNIADVATCLYDADDPFDPADTFDTIEQIRAPCAGASDDTFSLQPGFRDFKVTFSLPDPVKRVEVELDDGSLLGTCVADPLVAGGWSCSGTCIPPEPGGTDWACTHQAGGTPGRKTTRYLMVTITGQSDILGSSTPLQVDYDNRPPSPQQPWLRERCDNYGPARVGPPRPADATSSFYWLKRPSDFACRYECGPDSSPARVVVNLDEVTGTVDGTPGASQLAVVSMRRTGYGELDLKVVECGLSHDQVVAFFDPAAPTPPDGPWEIVAQFVDRYGNYSSQTSLGTFEIDSTAPASLATQSPGQVAYTRAPWGASVSDPTPVFRIDGLGGSVATTSPTSPVSVVLLGGPAATGIPLGCKVGGSSVARVEGTAGGGFSCDLPTATAPPAEVWVAQEDAAGNRSPPALVHEGTWTARPLVGTGNPNLLTEQTSWRPARDTSERTTVASLPLSTDGQPRFEQGSTAVTTPNRMGYCAATWSPERGQVVMVGGRYRTGTASDEVVYSLQTWLWDGRDWSGLFASLPPAASASPSARASPGLAHDRRRARTVLFGGRDAGSSYLGDIWELDAGGWRKVCTASSCSGAAPPGRRGAALFWDPISGEVILFGGIVSSGGGEATDDMWSWNGSRWRQLAPATKPSARAFPLFATDPATGKTLLVSGTTGSELSNPVDDKSVWEWNGTTWTSRARPDGVTVPDTDFRSAQLWFETATSPATSRFLLYRPGDGTLHAWNGTWFDAETSPAVLGETAAMAASSFFPCGAYDEERRAFVRFGGCKEVSGNTCRTDTTPAEAHQETFAFAAGAWRQLQPASGPSARGGAATAWDPMAGNAFIWGGSATPGTELFDGWRWDGWRWTGVGNVGTEGLYGAALAAWGGSGPLVRYGGTGAANTGAVASTFTLSGSGTGWTSACGTASCGATPSTYLEPIPISELGAPRADQALAYYETGSPAVGSLLYFRGQETLTVPDGAGGTTTVTRSATWKGTYDSGAADPVTWSFVTGLTDPPASTSGHRMTWCNASSATEVVLFGGAVGPAYLNQTWVWDGAAWTDRTPANPDDSPPARAFHAQFCDADSRTVVVVGGQGAAGKLDDVWQWNGTRWIQRFPAKRPSARSGAASAWGGSPGQGLVFGGLEPAARSDTWIWKGGGDARPAHVFTVPFSGAGIPPSRLQSLTVSWRGGATAQNADGSPRTGTQLYAWNGGAWGASASVAGGTPTAASTATWQLLSGFDPYFTGDALDIAIASVPQGMNGTGVALLLTEYPELRAEYWHCLATGRAASLASDCCSNSISSGVCP